MQYFFFLRNKPIKKVLDQVSYTTAATQLGCRVKLGCDNQ